MREKMMFNGNQTYMSMDNDESKKGRTDDMNSHRTITHVNLMGGNNPGSGNSPAATGYYVSQAQQLAAAQGNSVSFPPVFHLTQNNQAQNANAARSMNEFTAQFITLARQFGIDCPPELAAATLSFMTHSLNQQPRAGLNGNNPIFTGDMSDTIGNNGNASSVLMVSNLNEDKVYPDALFTLFGVYGDVLRVKIMFNKKNTALIQFSNSHQAMLAMQHLSGKELWGKPMKMQLSRSGIVQLPKNNAHADLTKDYTCSKLHRFRKPHSKNFFNIFSPNNVLHLSNIPDTVEDNHIPQFFESHGFKVVNFRFMQKDKRMALIELDSTDVAMQALIALHNAQVADNAHLRISFSKSGI